MKPVAPKPAVRKPAAAKAKAPVAVEATPAVPVAPVVAKKPEPVKTAAAIEAKPAAPVPPVVAKKPEPAKTIAAETEKTVKTVVDATKETVEKTVAVAQAETKKAAETLAAAPVVAAPVKTVIPPAAKPSVAKVFPMTAMPTTPFKGYDDFAAFSKANMDAFIQANQVFAKGIEEMSKEMMSLTQASMESAAAAAKAVFTAKTFKDVVDLNTDYTKTSFDKFVANSTKLSEMSVKVATDALAPVTARVNVAVEKMLKPVA